MLATKERTNVDEMRLEPVAAVARALAVSRSKIYMLMDSGELPFVKLGKSRRIRWDEVVKLVNRNTVGRAD